MANLTPWQLLLWIVGVEIVSAPVIITIVRSAIDGYFRAKATHTSIMAKAVAEGLEMVAGNLPKPVKKEPEVSQE